MSKPRYILFALLLSIGSVNQSLAAEVLQSISDDTVNVSIQAQPGEDADRRFSYRVICSPLDSEALPDCEPQQLQAADDKPSMLLPVPDFPADAADVEVDQTEAAMPKLAEQNKPRKQSSKKSAKKTAKHSLKKSTKRSARNKRR